jgi:hypothetical protein
MSPLGPAAAGFSTRRIQAIVESLIDILDENDGDPDPEPSLGWSHTKAQEALGTSETLHDLEEEHEKPDGTHGKVIVHFWNEAQHERLFS